MPILVPSARPIDGDVFNPAVVALGIASAIAIGCVVWEFWFRNKR